MSAALAYIPYLYTPTPPPLGARAALVEVVADADGVVPSRVHVDAEALAFVPGDERARVAGGGHPTQRVERRRFRAAKDRGTLAVDGAPAGPVAGVAAILDTVTAVAVQAAIVVRVDSDRGEHDDDNGEVLKLRRWWK